LIGNGKHMLELTINGQTQTYIGNPEMPLLWFLRDVLDLKGTKFGCGVGLCGVCTILIDGKANHACMVTMEHAAGRKVETIEGLVAQNHYLLHAWIEHQVPQCGYCQPGQIMAAAGLFNQYPNPTDDQTAQAMSSVLCRCGTYQRIRRAITGAAQLNSKELPELASIYPILQPTRSEQGVALDEWIHIAAEGTVTLRINHAEMGQGAVTGLAMLVAEELDVDFSRMRTEFAPAAPVYRNPLFNEQTTGGSTSIRSEWRQLRMVGAKARWRLVRAAAHTWQVPHNECRTEDGTVYHDLSQRKMHYGELAPLCVNISAPATVTLKHPDKFRLIGQSRNRLEIPLMVAGRVEYGVDVHLEGMLNASVLRRPHPSIDAQSMDMEAARLVDGVIDVVPVSNGYAVLADSNWAAIHGRTKLQAMWQDTPNQPVDDQTANNEQYQTYLLEALQQPGEVIRQQGNAQQALRNADTIIEATYETSFLAHAAMETLNCTAQISDGQCEVWLGTQTPEGAQTMAAAAGGFPKSKVHIHSLFIGGAFGRRLESDYVVDAVELAGITGKPVQVLWSRADDMQHDFYRPAHATLIKTVLDAQGRPAAWWQRSAGEAMALQMVSIPYDIPNYAEERVEVESPLPVGAWRSVGAGQNAFIVEGFMDELAHAAGADPLEYRLKLLPRASRSWTVLQYAAEKAFWGSALPDNHYRGIAHYESFGSRVAQVAELSVERDEIRIHKIVCAVDCGRCINPDAVSAQIEGAIAMGLSAALKEQVLFDNGMVTQSNLEEYPILTFAELPEIEVYIVPSTEPPGGIGEPGLPPVAPAVANAVFAATGKRLRKLPLRL
jgi:isoquinoline 1-oxidoreductase beta subunit